MQPVPYFLILPKNDVITIKVFFLSSMIYFIFGSYDFLFKLQGEPTV
jgi:hypothetical protein